VSDAIRAGAKDHPSMHGMACTLVAALLDADTLHLAHVGDSRAYLLRDRQLVRLTADDAQDFAQLHAKDQRRLLTQTLGTRSHPKPTTRRLTLRPDDRLLLCTDGLTDPVPDVEVGRVLGEDTPPLDTAQALVALANARGGPDNITVVVLDFLGTRAITAEDRHLPPRAPEAAPGGHLVQTLQCLAALEADLAWLHGHAATLREMTLVQAMALVKRELGRDVAQRFLGMRPSENATHVASAVHRARRAAIAGAGPAGGLPGAAVACADGRGHVAHPCAALAELAGGRGAVLRGVSAGRDQCEREDADAPDRPHAGRGENDRGSDRFVATVPARAAGVSAWLGGSYFVPLSWRTDWSKPASMAATLV
jgi:hypothetical protein